MPSLSPTWSSNVSSNHLITSSEKCCLGVILSNFEELKVFEDSTFLITQTLGEHFVTFLPDSKKIEQVYWAFEEEFLRVWTFINHPDSDLEELISHAQLGFMDKFPELQFDFTVIYRFDKELETLRPTGATAVNRQ